MAGKRGEGLRAEGWECALAVGAVVGGRRGVALEGWILEEALLTGVGARVNADRAEVRPGRGDAAG